MNSISVNTIKKALNGLLILKEGSRYQYADGDIIINWGCSEVPSRYPISLNQPNAVSVCCSKIRSYKAFAAHGVPTCEWTTQAVVARSWFNTGHPVYARSRDSGAQGQGISVIQPGTSWDDQIANALAAGDIRFFTKRIDNEREFRVYVVGDSTTSVLEKRRRTGTSPSEFVRFHDDWIFARSLRGPVPDELLNVSKAAIKALGLDFGGVDIVLDSRNKPVVLEVNSAPGLATPSNSFETAYNYSTQQFCKALTKLIKERLNVDLTCS
jgi:hypothetical protein